MAFILSLETSTDVCSVALFENETLLKTLEIRQPQSHASQLAPLISEVMSKSGIAIIHLAAVAITSGPGSYTGLRIGTSTAKGICFSLNIPLISISTLELLAAQAGPKITEVAMRCPMIDARRMEVYCSIFDVDLRIVGTVESKVIDEKSFQELLEVNKMFFFGNGAEKCKSSIQHKNAYFLDDIVPLASTLGVMAYKKFLNNEFEDIVNFTPFISKIL